MAFLPRCKSFIFKPNDKNSNNNGYKNSKQNSSLLQVIQLTEKNLNELRQMIKEIGKHVPPDIFLEEYEEQLDKLFYLKGLLCNRTALKLLGSDSRSSDSSINQSLDDNILYDDESYNQMNFLRTSTITYLSRSPDTFNYNVFHLQSNTNTDLQQAKFTIENQTIMVRIEKGMNIEELLRKHERLKKYPSRSYKLLVLPVRKPIKWEDDAEKIIGLEVSIELRLVISKLFATYQFENLPTYHNYNKRKFIFSICCDVCGLKTFSGIKCKICLLQGHNKCLPSSGTTLCFGPLKNERESCSSQEQLANEYMDMGSVNSLFFTTTNNSEFKTSDKSQNSLSRISENSPYKNRFKTVMKLNNKTEKQFDFQRSMTVSTNHEINIPRKKEQKNQKNSLYTSKISFFGTDHANNEPPRSQNNTSGSRLKLNDDAPLRRGAAIKIGRRSADFIILLSEIRIGNKVGSGTYGTVYKGYWHGPVAVKKFNVINEPTSEQLESFLNEVSVLRKTRHRHILLFMGLIEDPLLIVTQWCEGKSLYNHLYVLETEISLRQRLTIACQTAEGMDYLHAKSIIHRDLKSNNILLLEDLTVKIGDFGLSTVKTKWTCKETNNQTQPTGSILWMAPEVIQMKFDDPFTQKSDVYAFGIVLYELMSSSLPYSEYDSLDQIMYMVGRGYLKPNEEWIDDSVPSTMKKLYRLSIDHKPEIRPNFSKMLNKLNKIYRTIPKLDRSASMPSSLNILRSSNDYSFSEFLQIGIAHNQTYNSFNQNNLVTTPKQITVDSQKQL